MVRRVRGACSVALALALALAGCSSAGEPGESATSGDGATSRGTTSSSPSRTAARPSSSGSWRPASSWPASDRALVADLTTVERAHSDAEVSVAVAPVGGTGSPQVVGDAPALVAWSTIKVPLSLAVIRSGQRASADIDAALTASDNEAAQRLWELLGSGDGASSAVMQQLRRGGDSRTWVPGEAPVPGYSAFGQAKWRLDDQTTFAAALPCLSDSSTVTDAMGRVADGQRWGLGGIDGARFKGGWGPTPDGYVVRQLGILPGTKGRTAVALQVRTGTHEQGTAIADEVAEVLRRHEGDLPTGSCG